VGGPLSREQLLADAVVELARSFLATGLAGRTAADEHRVVVFADEAVVSSGPGAGDADDCDVAASQRDEVDAGCWDCGGALSEVVAPRAHLERGAVLTEETIRRIWCDTAVTRVVLRDGAIVAIEEPTRTISVALRRALGLRDSQCRFPGCNSRRVDAHHIRYRRHHGPTVLGNLVSLCRFHHKLIHEGGYSVGHGRDGTVRFYDPTGRELHHGSALSADHGGVDALRARHRERGVAIDEETIVGNYSGDRLDLAYASSVLARPSTRPGARSHQPASPHGPKLN